MRAIKTNSCIIGVLVVVMVVLGVLPAWAEGSSITVTGDADVRVVPDEVVITLGVETWDKDLTVAKKSNDSRVEKVLAVTQEFGIDAKHVQTEYINIEPRYRFEYEKSEFIGYFVRKTIVVTLKDISKFEDLLTRFLEAGANYVHGVEFRTTELRKYRDQARALAIKAAQEKATALAEGIGLKVGKPTGIHEDQTGWWSSYNSWWGERWGSQMAQNVVQNAGDAPSTIEGGFAPGQIRVNARVTVSFELE